MSTQNYQNHIRFYPLHHFIFYPVISILTIFSGYFTYKSPENRVEWLFITAIFISIIWLSLMLRQHYALGNQNRIVRLEMRLRYYQLTNQRFERYENQLSFSKIAALRFASDEELPGLLQRAINEHLSSKDIKKSIKNWQADEMRL